MQAGSDDKVEAPLPRSLVRRNRLFLVMLVTLTLLPLGAAVSIYYGAPWMVAGAQTNRGWLLEPPGDLETLALRHLDDEHLVAGERRRWRLLVFPGAHCDDACVEAIELLRQVHILLGRDEDRVLRFAVITPEAAPGLFGTLQRRLPEMELLRGPSGVLSQTLTARNLRGRERAADSVEGLDTGVLTVDPLGNVILYHGLDQIGSDLLADLKQLLRLSNIG
ncbi:MAG: hypothetical protein EA417_14005 [Gammaproteobacteria bacterium]|nr:MAG: hypothetical protein EA417_14005 [Gammaproteobacteria bacterium]